MSTPIQYDLVHDELKTTSPYGPLGKVTAVTLHHSVSASPLRKASVIKLLHEFARHHSAEFGSGGVGYHYVIDRLGRIYRTRPDTSKGAHTARHNSGNVGICVLGDFSNDRENRRQREAIRYLVEKYHDRGVHRFLGHCEWPDNPTACPGRLLEYVKYLRQELDLSR